MSKDFKALLFGDDERAAAWRAIFGSDEVEIRSPISEWAMLPEKGKTLVYQLDIEALSEEQRRRLIDHIAERFSVPAADVDDELDRVGCPILAENVTISIANPYRWL